MHTPTPLPARFGLTTISRGSFDGVWWPHTRLLSRELPLLIRAWPADESPIVLVAYAFADWADTPRAVTVADRRGPIRATTHQPVARGRVALTTLCGRRSVLRLISSDADEGEVRQTLRALGHPGGRLPWKAPHRTVRW